MTDPTPPLPIPTDNAGLESYIRELNLDEIECLVSDMTGVARGKILPGYKFLKNYSGKGLRIPEEVFAQTISGNYPEIGDITNPSRWDIYMMPVPGTVRPVPWYPEPTALVICDCVYHDDTPVAFSPRYVLQQVLARYAARGWRPVVAPELEFYLVQQNPDSDYPLVPPVGISGRAEVGRQAYGIEAVNDFDPVFEDVYDYCEAQRLDIDTLIHEAGAGQMEINFNHGDPLELADQVFLFKRTVRQAALNHKVHATFMAKPLESEPGSAMHVHVSVEEAATGKNLFANKRSKNTALFKSFIAGQQRYLPEAMLLLAPNVNSYRRLIPDSDAPINLAWGFDNRTAGLRVPWSRPEDRRVENRVAGADANPYLALAAVLACGLKGMEEGLTPDKPVEGDAYLEPYTLPRDLYQSIERLRHSTLMPTLMGDLFVRLYCAVKDAEATAYRQTISAWEREHLLLRV